MRTYRLYKLTLFPRVRMERLIGKYSDRDSALEAINNYQGLPEFSALRLDQLDDNGVCAPGNRNKTKGESDEQVHIRRRPPR